ncbi:hypothetical protein DSM03_101669 [Leeuwenhoekiella aestuarii]|uniref:Signal peptidase n=1 Tax=Leeuwenhoekiella aestuarii TaxID=2249426 RepID=A0A4Q0NZ58_9FLAO|nr:hypothetical protein [Leeuwenhoekiella aestuarii]RXG17991.1 hypothetical protein DSM04_101177 [Leeuwenhoekiella aestuarii]RXG19297.1 hypothetical protein DSM03_101669 [Leeuwenhoekiella aestuarii]
MNFRLYTKYVVALAFAIGFVCMGYAEKTPPAPEARAAAPPPLPPGLMVPIDDYIPYLLIIAFFAGVYFYSKHNKNQATNS